MQHIAMPAPLSGSAAGWASTGISTPNTGEVTVRPEQRLVALVVGVGDQRHQARDQLGAGRLDEDRSVGAVEGDAVVVAGVLPRLQLGLRDRGLEGDVPERRRLLQVGLAAGEVAQERALADLLRLRPDRRVVLRPVDREPEGAPQVLEDLLVLLDQLLAQLDEVRPADRDLPLGVGLLRRREVGVVGQRRVAADAEVVLHPALGRQAVVVPAHRVEDLLAPHPLVARDEVGVRVGEDVPDVQRARHGRRGSVDRVDFLARLGAVERVGVLGLPLRRPLRLEALERGLVRYDGRRCRGRRSGQVGLGGVSHARILRAVAPCSQPVTGQATMRSRRKNGAPDSAALCRVCSRYFTSWVRPVGDGERQLGAARAPRPTLTETIWSQGNQTSPSSASRSGGPVGHAAGQHRLGIMPPVHRRAGPLARPRRRSAPWFRTTKNRVCRPATGRAHRARRAAGCARLTRVDIG